MTGVNELVGINMHENVLLDTLEASVELKAVADPWRVPGSFLEILAKSYVGAPALEEG